jgi:trk system potassium uptake protein TrkH
MNHRAVGWLLGCVSLLLAGFLLVPAVIGYIYDEPHAALDFLYSSGVSAVFGASLILLNRGRTLTAEGKPDYFRREGLAAVGLSWLLVSLLGSLPYLLTETMTSVVDAFFETASGFTTTGSTVLTDEGIEGMSHAIGFWRSFTHWLGGFGIVMVFVVLFPTGGRSLFRSETPGISREAGHQRVRDSALGLMRIYVGMSLAEFLLLWLLEMTPFDAAIHTFGTISTGGFSTHADSIAYFMSWKIELVIGIFMFAAGINFAFYDLAFRTGARRGWNALWKSLEFRVYAGIIFGSVLLVATVLWIWGGGGGAPESGLPDYRHYPQALRDSFFQVISLQTGTGYATADFDQWPQFCRILLMGLCVIGACAGSTCGGLKVIRLVIVARAALRGVQAFVRPRAIHEVKVDGHVLEEGVVGAVTGYFILWILVFFGGVLALSGYGIELEDAGAAVLATLNNVGPGLGRVGPSVNYAGFPDGVKLLLSIFMILGRLEFYAVVALFVPGFWRR